MNVNWRFWTWFKAPAEWTPPPRIKGLTELMAERGPIAPVEVKDWEPFELPEVEPLQWVRDEGTLPPPIQQPVEPAAPPVEEPLEPLVVKQAPNLADYPPTEVRPLRRIVDLDGLDEPQTALFAVKIIDKYHGPGWCARLATSLELQHSPVDPRPCTCNPADNPPVPCERLYALDECIKADMVRRGLA